MVCVKFAGEDATSKGAPKADNSIVVNESGSVATIVRKIFSPATIQVSFIAIISGGLLSVSATIICISRTIVPIQNPSRNSEIRIAILYSPGCCGESQINSPVFGSKV